MSRQDILEELEKLPADELVEIIKSAINLIDYVEFRHVAQVLSRAEIRRQMAEAAKLLLPDYLYDEELTAFTALDGEDIYEDEKE